MTRRHLTRPATLLLMTLVLIAGCGGPTDRAEIGGTHGTMILATTTSTRDTGLLDLLAPRFEKASSCRLKTLSAGSGEALTLGERGDADVLLVHSPAAEEAYMRSGAGRSRRAVMHNDYVLVGPADDPASVAAAANAVDAMKRIADVGAPFASRDDDSGTNAKELELWAETRVMPADHDWYVRTGQGMGQTLTIADQKAAYTLSDRGTFLAMKNVDLMILHQSSSDLRNSYHVIVVRHAGTNLACARAFAAWITGRAGQAEIAGFGVAEYGQALFFPDAKP